MIKNYKKSQAAMEFLMTYGWAILVVIVGIGALAYFGVLSPDRFLPDRCTIPPGLPCVDHRISSTSGIEIVLRNSIGINIESINLRVGGCILSLVDDGGDDAMKNREIETFRTSAANCGIDTRGGAKFKTNIGVTYINSDSGLGHALNGTLTGRIE